MTYSNATQQHLPFSADTQQNVAKTTGFSTPETAKQYLLMRASDLVEDGVYPRQALEPYLDALVKVLHFVHTHTELFAEAHLGWELCDAVEKIAMELHMLPHVRLDRLPQEADSQQELVGTAAMLLRSYRDSVRRVARGSQGLTVRAAFGLAEEVDAKLPTQVAAGIDVFLKAAEKHPDVLWEAGISAAQLRGLLAQKRVLSGWICRQPHATNRSEIKRVQILHAAVEYFFDRYGAVVSAKFLEQPALRLRGLSLIPRQQDHRI